jgi:isoquinoline 1-oxidoreductase alpha subunit
MVTLIVNGQTQQFEGDPEMPLLWYLRDEARLTGTKFGCGMALCGACTVHMDGQPVRSCVTPISVTAGKHISTIESVHEEPIGQAVQAAWIAGQVPQCGYCQSGQIMSAVALLRVNPAPNDDDIDAAMSGNVCRCATYERIRKAIHSAATALSK